MTKFKTVVAVGATMVAATIGWNGVAQDDLDDLLKDLEGEDKKPAAAAPATAEDKAVETLTAAEEKAEEKTEEVAAAAEKPAEEAAKVEEKAEEKVADAEEKAEETVAAAEEKAEEKTEEVAAVAAVAEKPAEEAAKVEENAEETVAAAKPAAAEKPASVEQVNEVLNLLNELSKESAADAGDAEAAPAAEEKPAVAEVKAEEPAAPAKTEEVAAKPVAAAPVAVEKPVVAAKPAAKPVVKPAHPEAELISNLATTEKLRRRALDTQAAREIGLAREAMETEKFTDAVRHYGNAAKLLNDRSGSQNLRRECDQGIAEGLYRAALDEWENGRREKGRILMEKALDMRHPKARAALDDWQAESEALAMSKKDISDIKHRKNDKDYKLSREQIRKHLKRSKQYFTVRDIEKALEEVEIVLANDPYNQEAIRLRGVIERKRHTILMQERKAAREGMIADVDEAWRPVYAVNAAQLNDTSSETVKNQAGEDPERTQEQDIENRMKQMRLPTISFKPPATIMDAVEFFRQASKDYDRPDIPVEKRGFNFVLKTPQPLKAGGGAAASDDSDDFSSNGGDEAEGPSNGLDPIPTITASDITFHEALKLVCDSVDYKFIVRGPVVMVMHKDMSTAELLSRKYDVLDAFLERMTAASSDVKEMKSAGFGGGNKAKNDEGEENQERDWKEFFSQMGVKWPEGSSIMYIKTLGKLYVRNTRENLAEFEKVLQEMGSQPKLIEIETRFVEVAQDDLNSLGFEWILNSDYTVGVGGRVAKALGLRDGAWGSASGQSNSNLSYNDSYSSDSETISDRVTSGGQSSQVTTSSSVSTSSSSTFQSQGYNGSRSVYDPNTSAGARWIENQGGKQLGFNAFGGTSAQQNGNRYLSTKGNHIQGTDTNPTNDQFLRVNAFLGDADLSMILHMLSQRSDTDLLSAPKVVTKSGENAVIKVVTEYIYPQDYDVQLQSSSSGSGGGSSSGGGQSAILAVVEPQNFTMREVGVILDVTPTYSEANGGTIDLELKPQVVDEPRWKDYGMRIPFTGNTSSGTMADIGNIFTGMATALETIGAALTDADKDTMAKAVVQSAMDSAQNVSSSSSSTMTWYNAPMEQPWFHVRSIDSKVSITPGATVVMGGLITEARKAMDDKIPFLGDIPYLGRLFRSHAEKTSKRNLLIFVTGRLITPSGRELRNVVDEPAAEGEVKEAPAAE